MCRTDYLVSSSSPYSILSTALEADSCSISVRRGRKRGSQLTCDVKVGKRYGMCELCESIGVRVGGSLDLAGRSNYDINVPSAVSELETPYGKGKLSSFPPRAVVVKSMCGSK
jgi:hypothetical protein